MKATMKEQSIRKITSGTQGGRKRRCEEEVGEVLTHAIPSKASSRPSAFLYLSLQPMRDKRKTRDTADIVDVVLIRSSLLFSRAGVSPAWLAIVVRKNVDIGKFRGLKKVSGFPVQSSPMI
jgi:hypothetical protein